MRTSIKGKSAGRPLAAYYCSVGASLLLVLLFESGWLEGGWLAVERQMEFVVATLMVLVTMGCIPLALRFKHIGRVARAMAAGGSRVANRVFVARVLLLGIPMFANTLLYYIFMSPRFGYMAIILLLCLLCIYPSVDNDNAGEEARQ